MSISSNKGQKEYDSIIESTTTASQAVRAVCNSDGSDILGGTVPTVLTGGEKTIATGGTGEALGGALSTKSIYIRAKLANTNPVFVGDSGVDKTTSQQIVLYAGEDETIDIADRATVYVDVTTNGEGVDYLCTS